MNSKKNIYLQCNQKNKDMKKLYYSATVKLE